MNDYKDVIIGLEVHIQLTALNTKLFCSCSGDYRGKAPNTLTCPICLGLPGSLPVTNEKAIEFATRLALALKCNVNKRFYFFRKNYYYPDLPKGFQISQYNRAGGKAFADGGIIEIEVDGEPKEITLNRIHLEEDPARIVHEGSIATSPYALIDYNRSGTTLIEVVSEPEMRSPAEAREYLKQLMSIVQYTEICDPNLEGAFRVDANISIKGHDRSEVKNINSIKEVENALSHEIKRQKLSIKRGVKLIQETRHWDGEKTISLRSKEFEADYRYFPEQDLVPFEIKEEFIEKVRKELPEMPKERNLRYQKEFQLSPFKAGILVLDKHIADFFEKGIRLDGSFGPEDYDNYCNWLMNQVSRWLNENNMKITETHLEPQQIADLIKAINNNVISTRIANSFIDEMMRGTAISEIIQNSGMQVLSDDSKLERLCQEVIKENPKIAEDYKKNPKAIQALKGKVMGKTRGQADPVKTEKILKELLK